MTREQITNIIDNIDRRHIDSAAQYDPPVSSRTPERITDMKRHRKFKPATVALVAVMALLLSAAAFAGYNHSLRELAVGEKAPAAPSETLPSADEGSEAPDRWDPLQDDYDFISLQGYGESPERRAMEEWLQFLDTYDVDGAELAKVGNAPTPFDEKYGSGYLVYTQEMADTLDAITEKYGLSLHTGFADASTDYLKELYGDFLGGNRGYGYMYDDGTFQFDGENIIEGYGLVSYQFRRTMKGVLDEVGLNVGDADSYEQWEYTSACGETLLLALGEDKALIFADLEDCFIAVNVLAGSGTDSYDVVWPGKFSAEYLEALADSFDFSLL